MKTKETKKIESAKVAEPTNVCKDVDCPFHGKLKTHGRVFEGKVTSKFHKRLTIEFERMIKVRKYERYARSKTKIHARLPICVESQVNIGDTIRIKECRPLSKIIHFVFLEKVKDAEVKE